MKNHMLEGSFDSSPQQKLALLQQRLALKRSGKLANMNRDYIWAVSMMPEEHGEPVNINDVFDYLNRHKVAYFEWILTQGSIAHGDVTRGFKRWYFALDSEERRKYGIDLARHGRLLRALSTATI